MGERMESVLSSFEQKMVRKERYQLIERSLSDLNAKFGAIYSAPKLVDLSRKEVGAQHQTEIGRNLKLRDLTMRCLELSRECKEIESNFHHKGRTQRDGDHAPSNWKSLVPVGRVELPGSNTGKNDDVDAGSRRGETKVCLNRSNVLKLQNY